MANMQSPFLNSEIDHYLIYIKFKRGNGGIKSSINSTTLLRNLVTELGL